VGNYFTVTKRKIMDPPTESIHKHADTMTVVNPEGKILQLFIPIKAICKYAVPGIPAGPIVFIEGIVLHKEHKMCCGITGSW
jgi:hypothetical protein